MKNNDLRSSNLAILLFVTVGFMCACSINFGKDSITTENVANQNQIANNSDTSNAANQNSSTPIAQTPAQTANKVCDNPKNPCPNNKDKEFEDYELSFQLPTKLGSKVYKSEEFYGVIFYEINEDEDPCPDELDSVRVKLEQHRGELQEIYPKNKVFAHHGCAGLGYVNYAIGKKPMLKPFIGFFAGRTKAEADKFFATVDQADGAKLVKMTVEFDNTSISQ